MKHIRLLCAPIVGTVIAATSCQPVNEEYASLFDYVCATVEEVYYDPDLGGVDWDQVQQTCRRKAITARSDADFFAALNCTLFQLGHSHLGVIPSMDDWAVIEPQVFASGTVGFEIRMIGDEAVVTSVAEGSPADLAELRPGWTVTRVDEVDIEEITARRRCLVRPPFNSCCSVVAEITSRLYGLPGTKLAIGFVDQNGEAGRATLTRSARGTPNTYAPDLPAHYEDFVSRDLGGGVLYIRFNTFMPGNAARFAAAVRGMGDATGLVIDLRGNPGGSRLVVDNVASSLISEPVLFAKLRTRDGVRDVVVEPSERPFTGPVAVIVDTTSRSASEVFAAGLQAIGRATVVGERTTGSVGPARTFALPKGATLVYPWAETTTPHGEVIEGHGVVPDVEVVPTRRSLLEGRDLLIEAARRTVEEREVI